MIDMLVGAGANDIGGINFMVSQASKLLDEAREQAIADARRKAEIYAKAAGVTLGAPLSISEGGSPGPMPFRKMAGADGRGDAGGAGRRDASGHGERVLGDQAGGRNTQRVPRRRDRILSDAASAPRLERFAVSIAAHGSAAHAARSCAMGHELRI